MWLNNEVIKEICWEQENFRWELGKKKKLATKKGGFG